MDAVVRDIIANAERLYADAIRMRTLGSHRTASSLFILAMEEAGKACLLRWVDHGYDRDKIFKELATGHIEKQLVYLAYVYVKCIRAVADIVPRAADHKQFDVKLKVGDNLREALAKEIYERTDYHNGTLRTGLYDHVKQSGFYTDVKSDFTIADPAFKDGSISHVLEEDTRDAIAMAREDQLTQSVLAAMYFNSTIIEPISGKQRREMLPDIIERLSKRDWYNS
jgi:AbiV family abortive infection protein